LKKLMLCTNWKMNSSFQESIDYAKKLADFASKNITVDSKLEVFILPDFLSLYAISQILLKSRIGLGAQNCYWEDRGAFTGEVSPRFIKEIGCKYIMAGHPERVAYFGEDPELINKKVKAILNNDLRPILFVVEREQEKNIKKTCNILSEQLFRMIKGIDKDQLNNIIIFYEPSLAIGSDKTAPLEHTGSILAALREALAKEYGNDIAKRQLFMYGGGVNLESARAIMELDDVNGIGMGKAGLNFEFFTEAIKLALGLESKLSLKK
jgi:triosephosphate isomerase